MPVTVWLLLPGWSSVSQMKSGLLEGVQPIGEGLLGQDASLLQPCLQMGARGFPHNLFLQEEKTTDFSGAIQD